MDGQSSGSMEGMSDGGSADWDDYGIFANVSAIPPGYGGWALANPGCAVASFPSDSVRAIQLTWAILCVIQGVFMMSRYPRVTWEPMYVPFVEAFCYGMQSSGFGFLRLMDGRLIPWARYVGWLLTTPVVINQINQLGRLRYLQLNMNSMAIAFDLMMIAFGMSANLMQDQGVQWLMIFFSFVCYCAVYRIAIEIFLRKTREFAGEGSREAAHVVYRIRLLATVFFLSWTVYPILHVLGPQTLCLMSEDTQAGLHILADVFAKNLFTFLEWSTVWSCMDGTWTIESMHARLGTKAQLTEAERAEAESRIWRATSAADQGPTRLGVVGDAHSCANGHARQEAAERGHGLLPFDSRTLETFARGLLLPASPDRSHMSSRAPNASAHSSPPRREVPLGAFSPPRPTRRLEASKPQGCVSPQATLRQLAALEQQTQIQRQESLSQRPPLSSPDVQGLNLLYQDMLRRLEAPITLSSQRHVPSKAAVRELQDLNAVARQAYGREASPPAATQPPKASPPHHAADAAGPGLSSASYPAILGAHVRYSSPTRPPGGAGHERAGSAYGGAYVAPMQSSSPPAETGAPSSFYGSSRHEYGGLEFQAREQEADRRKIDLLAQRLERMRQRLPPRI